ncbi:MAG: LicD family protein [Eubacterium sp.]|nr:LicD family protein [Eubacterium sp.]
MIDLLDARGYEINIKCVGSCNVIVNYIGAAVPEYDGEKYDNDDYVLPRIKNQSFENEINYIVKDTGISKTGMRISLTKKENLNKPEGNCVNISIAGENVGKYTFDENGCIEEVIDVTGIKAAEKAYLKDVHRKLYILLGEIDRVCKLHNIKYYLVFGGLLGAYRYGEIIPWDDDIDVAMTRKDFEKFRRTACKDLESDFKYLDASRLGNGAFLDFMCRVLYTKEETEVNVFNKVSGKCKAKYEKYLPMDIFVLDAASDNKIQHKLHMFMIRTIYGLAMGHRAYIDKSEYKDKKFYVKAAVRILSGIGKLIPAKVLFKLHDRVSVRYYKKNTSSYFCSNGYLPFIHTKYDKKWFGEGTLVKLGDMQVIAPNDIEAYLKRAYYEYYHLPSMKSRYPQHSPESEGVR